MNPSSIQKNSRKKVIVIGAGFAGLSTACFLAEAGFSVEVIESSSRPGGRAYSFKEKNSGNIVDNGQHILMGCYQNTFRFFNLIGADKNFNIQENLEVNFIKENRELYPLKTDFLFYPVNLFTGMLRFKALTFGERLRLLKIFFKLYLYSDRDLEKLTVYEWLKQESQTDEAIKCFWEILAVSALNSDIKAASAKIFADILKQMFYRGNKAASIVLPADGLSESYCINALNYLKENGGIIKYSETVTGIETSRSKVKSIITTAGRRQDFDYIVSAIPFYAFKRIMPSLSASQPDLKYSSILSVHIWLNNNNLKEKFYGLINSPVHWVFNHSDHITLVISNAEVFNEKSKEEVYELCYNEMNRFFGITCDDIKYYKIIKEKRATFIPSNDILKIRAKTDTPYKNLFLAGDWINTGLPSTIEGAVKSGLSAAAHIIAL